jgi:transcriptional regulator GlxA family with amidase domain
MQFSNIQLKRGSRFVQSDDLLFTAGGLTSGIDRTLHIVKKFYRREAADRTAAAYTIVRPRESIADTQPQLQPALLRLSAMISDIAPLFWMGTLSFVLLRVHADLFVSDQHH